jgi:glucokinase
VERMYSLPSSDHETAVLGTVGRKRVCLALADPHGVLRPDTIRRYEAEATSGVSDALSMFKRDLALPALPERSAIAIAGLARGDAISVTRTRWFLSRAGVQAMLGQPPLILNDFAAQAWALGSASTRPLEMFAGPADFSLERPGCYCVLGITSGLGAAVVTRAPGGGVTVLATEAGHGGYAPATAELAELTAEIFPARYPVAVEDVISASGLTAIYAALCRRDRALVRARTPEDITRGIATDPMARRACDLLAQAFWAEAGGLVMTYGAWDGLLITGALGNALRPLLRRPEMATLFVGRGRHARTLAAVPRALVGLEHAELVGAAVALRAQGGSLH